MYECQLCSNTHIPEKIYEKLDWEAVADDELVICTKCLSGLVRNKEADVHIRIQAKGAVLVKITWEGGDTEDE